MALHWTLLYFLTSNILVQDTRKFDAYTPKEVVALITDTVLRRERKIVRLVSQWLLSWIEHKGRIINPVSRTVAMREEPFAQRLNNLTYCTFLQITQGCTQKGRNI